MVGEKGGRDRGFSRVTEAGREMKGELSYVSRGLKHASKMYI
jgi:hypothetical protein